VLITVPPGVDCTTQAAEAACAAYSGSVVDDLHLPVDQLTDLVVAERRSPR